MSAEVIHGDCLEEMKAFPDGYFDATICDPPYGTTALDFDQTPIDWAAWWAEVHRVTKETGVIVCFAADLFTVDLIQSNRKNYRYRLVWEKTLASGHLDAEKRPLRAHEDILLFAQRMKEATYNPQKTSGHAPYRVGSDIPSERTHAHSGQRLITEVRRGNDTRYPRSVLHFSQEANRHGAKVHPTQKPLPLMEYLVRTFTNPGDKVLDPFCGSGTTGAACVALHREFVGIELDATYHATAQKRVQNAVPALLGAS